MCGTVCFAILGRELLLAFDAVLKVLTNKILDAQNATMRANLCSSWEGVNHNTAQWQL